MGNTPLTCANGGGKAQKIRVLLPDANILLMDEPVQVVDLMIEHINHMVVHCSTAKPGAMGTRPTMTIMHPDEMLRPGQAYVVHPIPSKYQKTQFKPQPLSIPKLQRKVGPVQSTRDRKNEEDDKKQESTESRKQRHARRCQNKVADSDSESRPTSEDAGQRHDLKSAAGNSPQRLDHHVAAKEYKPDPQDQAKPEGADEDDDVLLNLKMYMGWRPALESIPESPLGYNHQLDLMQTPPVLVV